MSKRYAAEWNRRLELAEQKRRKRWQEALATADRCAQILYEGYGVAKVYVFGSLNDPEAFHDRSDIDLVVEGLSPHLYFKALAELWRQLPPGLELDLIPFEDAEPELRRRVLEEGVTLSG